MVSLPPKSTEKKRISHRKYSFKQPINCTIAALFYTNYHKPFQMALHRINSYVDFLVIIASIVYIPCNPGGIRNGRSCNELKKPDIIFHPCHDLGNLRRSQSPINCIHDLCSLTLSKLRGNEPASSAKPMGPRNSITPFITPFTTPDNTIFKQIIIIYFHSTE